MRPGIALRFAVRDMFRNSWRLVPVNIAFGAVLVAVGIAAYAVHVLLVLAVLAGPVAAALIHCSVLLARTENVTLADARAGLILHWRRGLQLGAAGLALGVLAAFAVHFYARLGFGWPLVFLTLYLVLGLGTYVAMVATLAIADPGRPLRLAARDAATVGVRRPGATLLLGLSLLLVNAVGLAAAMMPFLTLTVAYSFLAVAHFTLPKES
jgi:hypothetical protein